jgi:N-acetylglutamate synthase-like GNAT family acetyltransferase
MKSAIPEKCPRELFNDVKKYIHEFELDDRCLDISEFITLSKDSRLLAFGRIREYESCAELCSVGVIEEARNLGLAQKLINSLSKLTAQPLYLVSILPDFFEKFGFQICQDYPAEIKNKLEYCLDSLPVPEPYVVMRLNPQLSVGTP